MTKHYRTSLKGRASTCDNPLTRKLFNILEEKQTNLCVAADVGSTAELVDLAKLIGPHICMLKLHSVDYNDFHTVKQDLVSLAKEHNFLLFEDIKYGEIGQEVARMYRTVVDWADIVTVHGLFGPEILKPIEEVSSQVQEPRGAFVVCQMSSKGNPYSFFGDVAHNRALQLSKDNKKIVVGVIGQELQVEDDHLIKATPGVHISAKGDNLDQTYRTPESVCESGSDIVIVGRGIVSEPDNESKLARTLEYKSRCWNSFMGAFAL